MLSVRVVSVLSWLVQTTRVAWLEDKLVWSDFVSAVRVIFLAMTA